MGVTSHWLAFDPAIDPALATVDHFVERGWLGDGWVVSPAGSGRIAAVPSWFEPNKRWYRNLDGESAWSQARQGMPPAVRAPFDRWFGHLFWSPEHGEGCGCGAEPAAVAPDEVVYDARLIRHIVELALPLDPVAEALAEAFAGGAPSWAGYPWMYSPDGFAMLVQGWQATLNHVARRHPGWSLLRWVWV